MKNIKIESSIIPLVKDTDILEIDIMEAGKIIFNGAKYMGKTDSIKLVINKIKSDNLIIMEWGDIQKLDIIAKHNRTFNQYTFNSNNSDNIQPLIDITNKRWNKMRDSMSYQLFNDSPIIAYFNHPSEKLLKALKPYYNKLRSANIIIIIETNFITPLLKSFINDTPIIFNFKCDSNKAIALPTNLLDLDKEFNPLHFSNFEKGKVLLYNNDNLCLMKFNLNNSKRRVSQKPISWRWKYSEDKDTEKLDINNMSLEELEFNSKTLIEYIEILNEEKEKLSLELEDRINNVSKQLDMINDKINTINEKD